MSFEEKYLKYKIKYYLLIHPKSKSKINKCNPNLLQKKFKKDSKKEKEINIEEIIKNIENTEESDIDDGIEYNIDDIETKEYPRYIEDPKYEETKEKDIKETKEKETKEKETKEKETKEKETKEKKPLENLYLLSSDIIKPLIDKIYLFFQNIVDEYFGSKMKNESDINVRKSFFEIINLIITNKNIIKKIIEKTDPKLINYIKYVLNNIIEIEKISISTLIESKEYIELLNAKIITNREEISFLIKELKIESEVLELFNKIEKIIELINDKNTLDLYKNVIQNMKNILKL
jgi:hypothetical protein